MTIDEIARIAYDAGWRGIDLVRAVAVSWAENGKGDPGAVSPVNRDGSRDYGLWQINSGKFAGLGLTEATAKDARANAAAAYRLQTTSKSGWGNWTTYTSGAYQKYIGLAGLAVGRLPEVGGTKNLPPLAGTGPGIVQGIGDAAGQAKEAVSAPFNAAKDMLDAFNKSAMYLGQPHLWQRVGLTVAGGLVVIAGMVLVVMSTSQGRQAAATVAKVAAA